jgi:hydrogenase maturation protease
MISSLVIGYGNELRCDDGVGPMAARELSEKGGSDRNRIIEVHQLVPELVMELSQARRVLFIDASIEVDVPRLRSIAAQATTSLTHVFGPEGLLALCQALGQGVPRAWLLTIPGACFDHGDTLSDLAQTHLTSAVELARKWLQEDD